MSFSHSVCWEQMTRKMKIVSEVETSTLYLCVFAQLLICWPIAECYGEL